MAESINQTPADVKNLSHLIFPVPLMVILRVRLFNGLTRRIKAANPAINGKSIITRPAFVLRPIMLKSLGLAAICENTAGFEPDFINMAISNGMAPIVFDTIRTTANIIIYLQKLFLPVNVDSRWFIDKG
jgi:hypothetical protein